MYIISKYFSFVLQVNDGFGFGVMDAKVLTDNAKIWKNVGTQLNCTIPYIENTE